MTQLSPDTSVYSKALGRLRALDKANNRGDFQSPEDFIAAVKDSIRNIYSSGEGFNFATHYIEHGSPALSSKINDIWDEMSVDSSMINSQLDYLKAHMVSGYNSLVTDLDKAKNTNLSLEGKLKTLLAYSSSRSDSSVVFSDFMSNYDLMTVSNNDNGTNGMITSPGKFTLGSSSNGVDLSANALVYITGLTNGFLGRNQEVLTNPDGSISFYADTDPHASITYMLDRDPLTWVEYEHNLISKEDMSSAGGLNFKYKNDVNLSSDSKYIDWADGPIDNDLNLVMTLDLTSKKSVNRITYTPHRMYPNFDHPVTIDPVEFSSDGTSWDKISDKKTIISNDINGTGGTSLDGLEIGEATWLFDSTEMRFIRFSIHQTAYVKSKIGHLYYIDSSTESITAGSRVLGPYPPISDIRSALVQDTSKDSLIKKTEVFDGKRWAIGIKDIAVDGVTYEAASQLVSRPFKVGGVVDRVSLDAAYEIPPSFGKDYEWVKFYVSPNDGKYRFRIATIRDDRGMIPEILAFNDPIPAEFREPGVTYKRVSGILDTIRVKIELSRPSNTDSSSPIIKWYKVKVIRK